MEREEYICTVHSYSELVYRIAWNCCKNRADAEDVMQNTFLKLFQCNKTFESEEHKKSWLIRVAINESHNIFRHPWYGKLGELTEVEDKPVFIEKEDSDLYDAVKALPQKYRIVVYLYYYEEYKVKEIAHLLHIRETTVQTRLMRARQKLKNVLEHDSSQIPTSHNGISNPTA